MFSTRHLFTLAFYLALVFLQCQSRGKNNDLDCGAEIRLLELKMPFSELKNQYAFYGKNLVPDDVIQDSIALVQVSNLSSDTIYIDLMGISYFSRQNYYKVVDGIRQAILIGGGSGWEDKLISLPPFSSHNFITSSYYNPAELNADEVEYIFQYAAEKALDSKKVCEISIIEKIPD